MLPKYQRTFVWNKDNYTNLIDSFKEKQFIPPVTIGVYKTTNGDSVSKSVWIGAFRFLRYANIAILGFRSTRGGLI